MRKEYTAFLMKFHKKKTTKLYKTASLVAGSIFFLALLPLFFIWIGGIISSSFPLSGDKSIMYIISIVSMVFGLFFMFWATYTQLAVGKGTPAPNAPTQRLIISGPYRLCRNPIEFGAIFYYFGIGTITLHSYSVGLVCFFLGLIVGSFYHKFFEEKELEQRFGEEYKKYKKIVPFLIPKLGKYLTINI